MRSQLNDSIRQVSQQVEVMHPRESKQKSKLNGSRNGMMVQAPSQGIRKPPASSRAASRSGISMESSDNNKSCTLNDAKYFTYKALPRSKRPFALKDFALIREIFKLAESFARIESTEVRLTDVLHAYDTILQRHGLDPTEDTFYYRMLLKLSLRPEHDWWNKLNKEILKNDLLVKANGFHSHKVLLYYWLQWRCSHKRSSHREKRTRPSSARISFSSDMEFSDVSTLQQEPMQCRDSLKLAAPQKQQQLLAPVSERFQEIDVSELPVLENKHNHRVIKPSQPNVLSQTLKLWQRLIFKLRSSKESKQKKTQQWIRAVTHYERSRAVTWYNRRLLLKAMGAWKNNAALVTRLAENQNRLWRLQSSFASWKDYIRLLHNIRASAVKSQIIKSWKQKTRRSVDLKKPFLKLAGHKRRVRTKKHLAAWHARYSFKVQLKLFVTKKQTICKRLILRGWKMFVQGEACRKANVLICLRRWSNRVQQSILQNWRNWVCYSMHLQHVRTKIDTWRRNFLQKKAFRFWLIWCQGQQALRKCRSFHVVANQRRSFTIWKECVSHRKLKKAVAVSSIRHFFFWHCRRALMRWRSWTLECLSKKQNAIVLKDFQTEKTKVHFWQLWFQQFNNEIIISQFGTLREVRSAKLLLRILSEHTVESQEKREKLRAAYYYWQLRAVRDAFIDWKEKCSRRRSCYLRLEQQEEKQEVEEQEQKPDTQPKPEPEPEPEQERESGPVTTREAFDALHSHSQREYMSELHREKVRRNSTRNFLRRWKNFTFSNQSDSIVVFQLKERLQSLPNQSNVAAVLLISWTCNSTFAIFEMWRHWYKMRVLEKKKRLTALSQLSRVLLLKACTGFRLSASFARRRKLLKFVWRSRVQTRTLQHMRYLSSQQAHLQNMNVQAMLHLEKRGYRCVWNAWHKYITDVQSISLALEKAHFFCRDLYFRKSFFGWFHVLRENRLKLRLLTEIKIRIDYSCLYTAVRLWHSWARQKKSLAINAKLLRSQQRQSHLFRNFHFWISFTHKKKCLRVATEIHRRSVLKCFLGAWISFADGAKRKILAEELVKRRVFFKFGRTAFLGWQDITSMAKHIRARQNIAAYKLRYTQLKHVFSKWRELVNTFSFLKHIFLHFVLQRRRRVYTIWFNAVKQQQNLRSAHTATFTHTRSRRTFQTLKHWSNVTRKSLVCKEQEQAAESFSRRNTLMRVGNRLAEWKTKQLEKRKLFVEARKTLHKTRKRLVFIGWSMQAYVSSEEKLTLAQLRRLQEQRLMSRTLRALHRITEENWQMRRLVLHALEAHMDARKTARASFWHRQRTSGHALKGWRARAVLLKNLRQREWSFRRKVSRQTFRVWRATFSNRKNLRSLASHLSSYHRLVVLKKFLPSWQARAEASRYQSQCLVFRCFKKWVEHSAQAAFWRCKQKQVTFIIVQSLEKRVVWAWHGLVREIAVRREEHYQQRLIQREAMGLATRTERRQKTELLHGILMAWRGKVQLSQKVLFVLNRLNTRAKREVWSGWLVLVIHSRSFKQVKWGWTLSTKKKSFTQWRRSSLSRIQENEQHELEAMRVAERKTMTKAWIQWKVLLRFNHERARALKECFGVIQKGQVWDTVRDVLNAWEDYAVERCKRREKSWAAEAAHKRHKLMDYFLAWRHYTTASIDSAAKLRGSIQLYQRKVSSTELELHAELRPSARHYRQSISAFQRHQAQQLPQELIIQEVKQSIEEELEGSSVVLHKVSPRPTPSENGNESCRSEEMSSKELNVSSSSSSRHLSLERGVYDGVVATEGWPYELPNGGVAWIRCMVEQCTPIQQRRRNDF